MSNFCIQKLSMHLILKQNLKYVSHEFDFVRFQTRYKNRLVLTHMKGLVVFAIS